jgi:transcriptional regulator with XRE-family HTH domain
MDLAEAPTALQSKACSLTGRRLHQARLLRGMTQADVVRPFGLPRTWISKIENGGIKGHFNSTIFKLAESLGVHPAFLVEENYTVALAIIRLPAMTAADRNAILRWCESRAA